MLEEFLSGPPGPCHIMSKDISALPIVGKATVQNIITILSV